MACNIIDIWTRLWRFWAWWCRLGTWGHWIWRNIPSFLLSKSYLVFGRAYSRRLVKHHVVLAHNMAAKDPLVIVVALREERKVAHWPSRVNLIDIIPINEHLFCTKADPKEIIWCVGQAHTKPEFSTVRFQLLLNTFTRSSYPTIIWCIRLPHTWSRCLLDV